MSTREVIDLTSDTEDEAGPSNRASHEPAAVNLQSGARGRGRVLGLQNGRLQPRMREPFFNPFDDDPDDEPILLGRSPEPDQIAPFNYEVTDQDIMPNLEDRSSSPGFEITGERVIQQDPPPPRPRIRRTLTPFEQPVPVEPPHDPPPLPGPAGLGYLPAHFARWINRAADPPPANDYIDIIRRSLNRPHFEGLGRWPAGFGFGVQNPANFVAAAHPVNNPHAAARANGANANNAAQAAAVADNGVRLPGIAGIPGFVAPRLDYEVQGFELVDAAPPPPIPRPATPYLPPKAAQEGFTRKADEEDEVVCPRCGDELATPGPLGAEDREIKEQVWAIRNCGHVSAAPMHFLALLTRQVYCGSCAQNRRAKTKIKKGQAALQAKLEPFKQCVVPDCGKSCVHRGAFIQIYL